MAVIYTDLSHHNPITSWPAIRRAYEVVCLKATQGKAFVSDTWDENAAAAFKLKFQAVIAYHWLTPHHDPKVQADHFMEATAEFNERPEFVVMCDVEGQPKGDPQYVGDVTPHVLAWINRVESVLHKRVIVYTGDHWGATHLDVDRINRPMVVARYHSIPPERTRWDIWQFTSSASIQGVADPTVDLNSFPGTLPELLNLLGVTDPTVPAQKDDLDMDAKERAQLIKDIAEAAAVQVTQRDLDRDKEGPQTAGVLATSTNTRIRDMQVQLDRIDNATGRIEAALREAGIGVESPPEST